MKNAHVLDVSHFPCLSYCDLKVFVSSRARPCFLYTALESVWQETVAHVPTPTGHFSPCAHLLVVTPWDLLDFG